MIGATTCLIIRLQFPSDGVQTLESCDSHMMFSCVESCDRHMMFSCVESRDGHMIFSCVESRDSHMISCVESCDSHMMFSCVVVIVFMVLFLVCVFFSLTRTL